MNSVRQSHLEEIKSLEKDKGLYLPNLFSSEAVGSIESNL